MEYTIKVGKAEIGIHSDGNLVASRLWPIYFAGAEVVDLLREQANQDALDRVEALVLSTARLGAVEAEFADLTDAIRQLTSHIKELQKRKEAVEIRCLRLEECLEKYAPNHPLLAALAPKEATQ